MKRSLIILAAVILIICLSGCQTIALSERANHQVDVANSHTLATAINAYNALHPDNILPDNVTMEQAKETLGDLWPKYLTGEDAEKAWKLVDKNSGMATAKE